MNDAPQFSPETPVRVVVDRQHLTPETIGDGCTGHVKIHMRYAQEARLERVTLWFTGKLKTAVVVNNGQRSITYREEESLFPSKTRTIWQWGREYPPPGEDILLLPFSFPIPSTTLPSFEASKEAFGFAGRQRATIKYKLKLEGSRSGALDRAIHIDRLLCVTPERNTAPFGPSEQAAARRSIAPLARHRTTRHFWQGESKAGYVQLRLKIVGFEDAPLPLNKPIPFTLELQSWSMLVPSSDTDSKDALYPTLSQALTDVQLVLKRETWWKATAQGVFGRYDHNRTTKDEFGSVIHGGEWTADVGPREWITEGDDRKDEKSERMGRWHQEISFASSLMLKARATPTGASITPSFTHPLIQPSYYLSLRCQLPDAGPELKQNIPITISSIAREENRGHNELPSYHTHTHTELPSYAR